MLSITCREISLIKFQTPAQVLYVMQILLNAFFTAYMITKLQNLPVHDWISATATSKDKFIHYILIYKHIFCRNILIDNEIFENKPCTYASIPNISIVSTV